VVLIFLFLLLTFCVLGVRFSKPRVHRVSIIVFKSFPAAPGYPKAGVVRSILVV